MKFSDLGLTPEMKARLQEIEFETMTPIQAQAIPEILLGRDVIGQAKTGSGKTAAFGVPLLERIDIRQGGHPELQALILCPTRELSAQVAREIRRLGARKIGLRVVELAGGVPGGPQARQLENGIQVAVGTPGRVLDHLERGRLDLSRLRILVLDEADRMLEMGFQDEMEGILSRLPELRQTLLFSATFPAGIRNLSSRYQRDPIEVAPKESPETPSMIREEFRVLKDRDDRTDALLAVLWGEDPESAIVFCNFKTTSFELARDLKAIGISAECLNGDLEQRERDLVMARFRNRSLRILVATDVAARGLDVAGLDLVVNFEFPDQGENYVHRIGRTGRAGKAGLAVSLILEREKAKAENILGAVRVEANAIEGKAASRLAQEPAGLRPELSAPMETLIILEGRKNKMRPGDILGALTGEAGGLSGDQVGKIEIHDFHAFVAIEKRAVNRALERLKNGRIKGRKVRVERPR